MTTLYLAWQDQGSRRWFPVGRLDADESPEPAEYGFSYIRGALEARDTGNFQLAVPGFPKMTEPY